MKLFIAPNSAVTFDSAMGYKRAVNQRFTALLLYIKHHPFQKTMPAKTQQFVNRFGFSAKLIPLINQIDAIAQLPYFKRTVFA